MATADFTDTELVELRRRYEAGALDRDEMLAAFGRLLSEVERCRADALLAEQQQRLAEAFLARGLLRTPRRRR